MIWSNLTLAWREITANLMRTALTTLGIVIGIAAVITLVAVGEAATANITREISGLGRNLLVVAPGSERSGGQFVPADAFELADAEAIEEEVPGIASVAAVATRSARVVFGNENTQTSVFGASNAYYDVREWEVALGRRFTAGEVRAGRAVCALGETVRQDLFGTQNPVGADIRLGRISCEVIAVMEAKGQSTFGQDQDDFVIAPLRLVQRRLAGNRDVNLIYISAETSDLTPAVQRDVRALLRERRGLRVEEENDFVVRDLKEVTQILSNVTGFLTILLSAVAAISLLVGGIGIMNIMLVSVTERTREIGIRLAIGALERDVLTQFLVESVLLSALGGVAGVAFGLLLSWGITGLLGWPFVVNPAVVLLAVGFAALVGILFGYFPARRAARLDPIDALRYE